MISEDLQMIAGIISSLIFASGTATMLMKTMKTKEVEAYSLPFLVLTNVGNLVYWLYVLSLPFGPIYVLHGFYTIAMIVMLLYFVFYRDCAKAIRQMKQTSNTNKLTENV